MSKILFFTQFILQINILQFILSEEQFYTLSENGEKGASLTTFTHGLFLISSSKKYKIINKNYNIIQENKNDAQEQNYFYNNFEIVESSINKITKESIILIAESGGSGNKINIYSFNMSDSLEESKNPKLIYKIDSAVDNSKISFIQVSNDKYLLSYFLTGNKYENLYFKYSSYEGFKMLKKFENNGSRYNYISCFLLYEQLPVCYYPEERQDSYNNNKCFQTIISLDIIFNNNYNRISKIVFNSGFTNCFFTKAVYLSGDYAVFCYMVDGNIVYCDNIKLRVDFASFTISIDSTNSHIYTNVQCSFNLNKIDLIKVDDNKFLFGCVSNDNKPIIEIITVKPDLSYLSKQEFDIQKNVKSTLTLFTHHLSEENNYYGIIFNDLDDNKLKYGYLNLYKCTPKTNKEILKIKFGEDETNTFKLSEYLDISIENPVETSSSSSSGIKYMIISLISIDNDRNVFNYKLLKDEDEKNIGDIIDENDEIIIEPKIEQVFSSGKFYIELAPLIGQIQGRSCKFEFDTICFEGCSTCKKYDNTATEISKHNCLSCKSNYYSLNDLCLTDCSLIQGYHNIFQTKECIYEELEFINDCNYTIWYIDQNEEKNFCSNSNFCPINIPYVYNNTWNL